MINFYVYLVVIVCGAAVLAIELLGTRLIAPFYGSGLYLWSALISVTLAALSVGYAIGGRLADRGTKLEHFCIIIALAGIWIVLIPWLRYPVLSIAENMGMRAAVLITATILFFPPLALLGMVTPYALRMKAATLGVVGRTAGNLYAISTVSSVFAAIFTGFFLIPNVGVYRLVLLIGLILIATAVLGLAIARNHKATAVACVLLATSTLVGFKTAPSQSADPANGLIALEQSAYAEIRVVDIDNARLMIIDGGTHTIADTLSWESYFPYVNILDITRHFFEQPGEMLLIGLGGGSVVKGFYRKGWNVDAVEIDPVVTEMARRYFGLRDKEAKIFDMDGRQYLITHDKTYDLVIMDAFGSSAIPFHLVTKEAMGLIRSRLTPNGVLAMNIESVGWDDIIVSSLAKTIGTQFENVIVLPIAEPPDQIGNIVLLASNRPLDLLEEIDPPLNRFSPEYDRTHAWDNQFLPDSSGIPILTDELNPVDIWAERVNLVARKQLHDYFRGRVQSW